MTTSKTDHRQKRAPSELALRLSSPITSPLLLCTPRPFASAFPLHRPLCEAPDAASELSGLPLHSTRSALLVNGYAQATRHEIYAKCTLLQRPLKSAKGGLVGPGRTGPEHLLRRLPRLRTHALLCYNPAGLTWLRAELTQLVEC